MGNLRPLLFILCLFSIACNRQDQRKAHWRGENRDGIYQETNLLKSWPEAGPELLWLTEEIGEGYGSPAIAGNQLFVNGELDSISHVFAFDLKGSLLWKTPNGPEFMGKDFSASFPGSRSAPTIFNDLVFATSGMGRLACLEAASGKEIWSLDMVSDLGGKPTYFGYSESPVVDENKVYCFPGGTESNVVALDKLTGKVVWTSKAMGDGVSYCSPMVITHPERNILVTLSREYLMGLDMDSGELLWSHKEDSVKLEGEYCNTPVYSDGYIYGVSGVPKGTGAYQLELSPDGKSISEKWRNEDVLNAMGGFVKMEDRLYSPSKDNKLKSVDVKTGMVVDSLRSMRGSLIYADGHLYCYGDNGNVNLIKIADNKMEVVSKFKIDKGTREHFAHPVINKGVLYIRHGNALMAYSIKRS